MMETLFALTQAGWREEAIDRGLQTNAIERGNLPAVLRMIRQERPGATTLIAWNGPERRRLLHFLCEHGTGYRSLLNGSGQGFSHGYVYPLLGWYETVWMGEPVEIVFAPTLRQEGCLIVIGNDEAILANLLIALEDATNRPSGRCLRYTYAWEDAPDLDDEIGRVGWDDIVLPDAQRRRIREAVEGFFRHRAAYAALGFGWRRGILLVGPPGTGKTMVCKAVAGSIPGVPFLYVRDFHAGHGEAVKTIFKRARQLAPCILAFEDIDGLVERHNRTVFLNELDGFQSNDGVLVIASSNHPGRIDTALLKRPSRFDQVFHIGLPGLAERRDFCLRLLARPQLAAHHASALDCAALAAQVAERTDGFTLAYLKEIFTGAALNRAEAGAMALDAAFAAAALAQTEELGAHLRRTRNPDGFAEWREPGNEQFGFHPVQRLARR